MFEEACPLEPPPLPDPRPYHFGPVKESPCERLGSYLHNLYSTMQNADASCLSDRGLAACLDGWQSRTVSLFSYTLQRLVIRAICSIISY